ncbi:MAG: hypothetical protein ACXW08_00340 [Solirubrobacteraceae bacterium]
MITLDDLRRVEPGAEPERVLVRVAPEADRAAVAGAIDAAVPGVKRTSSRPTSASWTPSGRRST